MKSRLLVTALLPLAVIAGPLAAQTAVTYRALNTMASTPDFIKAAGQADKYVIEEGKLASERTQDPQVRAIAQELMQAHMETTKAMQQAVRQAGLPEPSSPSLRPDQKVLFEELKQEQGADFDHLYLEMQAEAHEDALLAMQTYAAQGDAPALRQAAAQTTPLLMRHLEAIQRLQHEP